MLTNHLRIKYISAIPGPYIWSSIDSTMFSDSFYPFLSTFRPICCLVGFLCLLSIFFVQKPLLSDMNTTYLGWKNTYHTVSFHQSINMVKSRRPYPFSISSIDVFMIRLADNFSLFRRLLFFLLSVNVWPFAFARDL